MYFILFYSHLVTQGDSLNYTTRCHQGGMKGWTEGSKDKKWWENFESLFSRPRGLWRRVEYLWRVAVCLESLPQLYRDSLFSLALGYFCNFLYLTLSLLLRFFLSVCTLAWSRLLRHITFPEIFFLCIIYCDMKLFSNRLYPSPLLFPHCCHKTDYSREFLRLNINIKVGSSLARWARLGPRQWVKGSLSVPVCAGLSLPLPALAKS